MCIAIGNGRAMALHIYRTLALSTKLFHLLCALVSVAESRLAQRQSLNTYVLNAETDLKLQWHVDDASATVRFALENPFYMDRKYFVFGFTKWGRLTKYDRVQIYHFNGVLKVVVRVFPTGFPALFYGLGRRCDGFMLQDQHVDANGMVRTDSQQDWTAMDLGSNVVGLERKIDTCDPEDLQIHVSVTFY